MRLMGRKTGLALAGSLLLAVPSPMLAQAGDGEVAVVQAHIDAYRARNLNAFLGTFSDDAVLVYQGLTFRGRSEIRTAFSLNFQPDAPTIYLVDSGIQGEQVWMQAGYTFADGSDMCCSLSRYTVRGGKIVHLEVSGPR